MRLARCRPAGLAKASAILAVGMMVLSAGAAPAWSRYRDHIYADSFGNLVIQSPSGYKRIIVGQGHLAKELSSYEGAGDPDPDVVYLDDGQDGYRAIAIATAAVSVQGPKLHVRAPGWRDPASALPMRQLQAEINRRADAGLAPGAAARRARNRGRCSWPHRAPHRRG